MSSSDVTEKTADKEIAAREETTGEQIVIKAFFESFLFQDNHGGGGVDHTPIIITDGSASIEFAENIYKPVDGVPTRRISEGLHLVKISAHRNHDPNVNAESIGRVCVPLVAGELYEIEFTCTRDGRPSRNFIIGGGPTVSPHIDFEHGMGGEYQKSQADFPSIDLGQRFGNRSRNITKMQIFKIVNGARDPIHTCGLVGDGCEYRILDIH